MKHTRAVDYYQQLREYSASKTNEPILKYQLLRSRLLTFCSTVSILAESIAASSFGNS